MDRQGVAGASAIVWREPIWHRLPAVYGVVPLLLVLVVVSVIDPLQPYTWGLGAIFAFNMAGELRRKCTLDGDPQNNGLDDGSAVRHARSGRDPGARRGRRSDPGRAVRQTAAPPRNEKKPLIFSI